MLKDILIYGSWAPGLIALFIVLGKEIYRKLKTPEIEVYEAGMIDLTYNDLGPVISLGGTIRAVELDVFVEEIRVQITRIQDDAKLYMGWYARTPGRMVLNPDFPIEIERVQSFLVRRRSPHKYNIAFIHRDSLKKIRSYYTKIRKEWEKFLGSLANRVEEESGTEKSNLSDMLHRIRESESADELFDSFYDNNSTVEAVREELLTHFFWKPGQYNINAEFDISNLSEPYKKKWEFEVSEPDSKRLKDNILRVLKAMCSLEVNYYTEYVEYDDSNSSEK